MSYNGEFIIPGDAGKAEQFNFLLSNLNRCVQGRLTLQSGVPVPTTDLTGIGTLYFTPLQTGNIVFLYDTTFEKWRPYALTEISLSLVGLTDITKPYDVHVHNNAGTLTLSTQIWTDATTPQKRFLQNGTLVHTDNKAKRLVGTIMLSASEQCSFAYRYRLVSNLYNPVRFSWYTEKQAAHSCTSSSPVLMNASETAKMYGVFCVSQSQRIMASSLAFWNDSARQYITEIGIDSVTVGSALYRHQSFSIQSTGIYSRSMSIYEGFLTSGYHVIAGLEFVSSTTNSLSGIMDSETGFFG